MSKTVFGILVKITEGLSRFVFALQFGIIGLMIITYNGLQFFKVQRGEMVLAFNPVSKSSKSGISAHFGADLALVTTNHPDYNGVEQLSYGERVPFVIKGPGEYEVRETFIKGALSESELGGRKYINTIYILTVDNINLVFLGALSGGEMSKEAREAISDTDILFVPVGGDGVLDAKAAAKLAASFEPKLIIPMDYDSASLKTFLKEAGAENAETVDKLTLKPKDLEGRAGDVIVLSALRDK